MNTWDELTNAALLGVGKQAIRPEMLPEPLRQRLANASIADREDYGFRAAALAWAWQMAGTLPPVLPPPSLEPAPDVEEVICPAALWSLLANCLEEPQRLGLFLDQILEGMGQKGYKLPHFLLVPTLKHCLDTRASSAKKLVGNVLGARGRWIAGLNPTWRGLLPSESETIDFDTATALERREWLTSRRTHDPVLVFQIIQRSWKEENTRERKEWLKILAVDTREEELAFLQELLESILLSKDKDKPGNLELRKELVGILLSHPETTLFKRVQEHLASYISTQSAMLGLVKKISLNIPVQGDSFLCKAEMTDTFALEPVSPFKGWSDSQYWFGQLVGMFHPVVWEQLFKADWGKIILAFEALHDEKKAPTHYPLQQLQEAVAANRYRPAILAITGQKELEGLMTPEMFPALSNAELEQFLMSGAQKFAAEMNGLKAYGREWSFSLSFSKFLLKDLAKQKVIYHDLRYIQKLALMIHPDAAPLIRDMAFETPEDYYGQSFQNQLLKPLTQLLSFRTTIEKAFHTQ